VKLHRAALDHPVLHAPNNFAAFFRMVAAAAFKPCTVTFRSKAVKLERGQLVVSARDFAERSGMTYQNFRTALAALQRNAMVSAEANAGLTLITITNFDTYQSGGDTPNAEANAKPNGASNADLTQAQRTEQEREESKNQESSTKGRNLPTNTASQTRPEGGAKVLLWAEMKAWLGGKDPGRLIAAWCRDHGEGPVFAAYFKALKSTPAEPKSWMVDELKRSGGNKKPAVSKGDQLLLDKFERPKIERQARLEIAATGLDVYTAEGGRAVVARMREIADARC
jgi:flagellar motor protein MotB